jgi:hypothetical protein
MVFCDHSVSGWCRTKAEAKEFIRIRQELMIDRTVYYFAGPYVLRGGGK